jgi:hypothetical protein
LGGFIVLDVRNVGGNYMDMFKSEISEVEKGFRKLSLNIKPTEKEVETMSEYEWITTIYPRRIYEETLKSAQAKFDKFVEDLKLRFDNIKVSHTTSYPTMLMHYYVSNRDFQELKRFIYELSSKQEKTK